MKLHVHYGAPTRVSGTGHMDVLDHVEMTLAERMRMALCEIGRTDLAVNVFGNRVGNPMVGSLIVIQPIDIPVICKAAHLVYSSVQMPNWNFRGDDGLDRMIEWANDLAYLPEHEETRRQLYERARSKEVHDSWVITSP